MDGNGDAPTERNGDAPTVRNGDVPTVSGGDGLAVSVVIPARNEAAYLPATLDSIEALDTERPYEVIVVDGDSEDGTPEIARSYGVRVVEGPGESIAAGRNLGARAASGEWLAFVDADTAVRPNYLDAMVTCVRENGLDAASSRCRIAGVRSTPMQATINRVFPRLRRPILPGFNFFVSRNCFVTAGGFPDVPNEDTAFSRRLGAMADTGYCPKTLVETSPRRISETGLTGTLFHYLRLDWHRLRAEY